MNKQRTETLTCVSGRRALVVAISVVLGLNAAQAQNDDRKQDQNQVDAKNPRKIDGNSQVQTVAPVIVVGRADQEGYVSKVTVGGKEARSLREIPNTVSVFTRQRIEEQNLSTVTEVLNYTPGVTAISNDTTQSQFYSRGYALAVAFDGIPALSGLSGYQQIDLPIYERVEVLRGPAGVLQGSDNLGGLVNLVRKRAKEDFAVTGAVGTGSWSNYRAEADVTGALNQSKTVRARAVVSVQDRDYFYDATHTRKWLTYGTLDWDLTPSTIVSLAAVIQDDKTNVPYGGLPAWTSGELLSVDRSTNPVPRWSRYEWNTKNLTLDLDHRFNENWSLKTKISRRDQTFYFKDSYASSGVDPATHTLNYARRVRDVDYARNALDVYLSGKFSLLDRTHDLLLGYNYDQFTTENVGVNASAVSGIAFGRPDLVPDFDLSYNLGTKSRVTQSGLYAQTRLHVVDPLKVVLGGRLSRYESKSKNIEPATPTDWTVSKAKASNEFTPYAGAVFDVSKELSFYTSYSDIFIPQSLSKANGDTLDPRVGKQWELGVKGEFFDGALNASVALFRLRDTGRSFADPDHVGYYLNAGEVESKGWEFEVSGSPAKDYQIQLGYTRQDSAYLKDPNNTGLQWQTWEPRHTFKIWGTRKFTDGSLNGLTLGLGANIVSGSSAGTGTWAVRSQGGYAVVNALASYRFSERLTVALNLNNIFDRTYYTRLGGLNTYNSYGEPRNVALSLRYKL